MAKILIVEDEKDIRDLVRLHLEKAGFETVLACNGQEAFQKIQESRPGLILLDLMLPEMDGKELTKLLKARPETRDIPIVMLTAKGEEVDRIVGFELGADDYIPKPFSPRELVLRIQAVLKRAEKKSESAPGLPLEVDELEITYEWDSAQDFTRFIREIAPPVTNLLEPYPPEQQEETWAAITEAAGEHADDGGTVRMTNLVLVAAGSA